MHWNVMRKPFSDVSTFVRSVRGREGGEFLVGASPTLPGHTEWSGVHKAFSPLSQKKRLLYSMIGYSASSVMDGNVIMLL